MSLFGRAWDYLGNDDEPANPELVESVEAACVECGEPATCRVPDLAIGPTAYCPECCPWPHFVEVDEGEA